MLLAEDAANAEHHRNNREGGLAGRASASIAADDFQDEMEAMAGVDDMY